MEAGENIRLFPTVTRDEVNLYFPDDASEDRQAHIFDYSGRLVKSIILETNIQTSRLNLRDLPAGPYVLKIQTGRVFETLRVVKVE